MPFFGSILPTPLTREVAQTYNEAVPCEGARHAARTVNPYGQGVKIRENVGESFKLSCGAILSLRKFLFPQGAHSHHCVPERIDPINLFCSLCRRGFGLQQVPRNKTIGFNRHRPMKKIKDGGKIMKKLATILLAGCLALSAWRGVSPKIPAARTATPMTGSPMKKSFRAKRNTT